MSDIAYRPRTIAELIDASIQLFRRCYRELVIIAAIGYIPWITASTIVSRITGVGGPADPDAIFTSFGQAAVLIIGGLWFAVVSAGCIAAASDRYLGEQPDVGRSVRRALSRAWPIIGTSMVTWMLTIIGAIFLIIPGLYLFARYAVSSTVALLEARPIGQSLSRAAELSRNRKLYILGALGAAWLIYLAIMLTVAAIGGVLGLARLSPLAEAALSIGISPLIGVVSAVLYYDLRIRGEGFDVELMERQLRTDPNPA